VEEIPQPSIPAKLGQEPLPIVTERRMTDVVPQSDRLNQVLVQPEEAAYGSGHFRDQLDMEHPVGDVVVLDQVKDLSFIDVSRVGKGMKDSIRIQRKTLPVAGEDHFLFRPSQGIPAQTGKRRESFFLFSVKVDPQVFQMNRFIQRSQSHSL
jgi:hypothetical protein